jgi:hypothetical protein
MQQHDAFKDFLQTLPVFGAPLAPDAHKKMPLSLH